MDGGGGLSGGGGVLKTNKYSSAAINIFFGSLKYCCAKFWNLFFQRYKISTAITLEGGEGLGLNGPAIKRTCP